ncbi:LysR family transcriptional regulator [Paraburkholderia fynbosensis]|uniref:HTH-type transcriptional regulator DmlR n=1 Tax=Paraburkholderia fynbosensis TaxID=1200993 RepID=A0A6J5FVH3_9BURK|nr:LysR family transcriptional regulator [Paraburkholderia fynbosensis]CAB3785597.1 HTH-type transcriptional regulator DmlR [Paraburkholderia fynbosensis]
MDYFAAVRTFVRAAELGSLTRAAQELSIKTSTVSRHLSELEADLRIALFNRSTRGLSLTEGGKVFYARVSDVLAQLNDAREATSSLNLSPSGVLRVTMPVSFGRKHIMPYLGEFMDRFRNIDVDATFTDDVVNLIESQIDLGIRIGELRDSSLMARRLAAHSHVACAAPAYINARGMPTTPAALNAHACLLFSRSLGNSWYSRPLGEPSAKWEKTAVTGRLTLSDIDALMSAAESGLGVAALPTWLADEALGDGRLIHVCPAWDIQPTTQEASIWAVYPRKKTVSSKVRSFIDFFAEKFGDAPYWERPAAAYLKPEKT